MPWRVLIIWALFLVRGSFYCALMPLWEGWDEYAHFAWLQHWVDKGTIPDFHDTLSREIDESMRLTPLAHELKWIGPPYLIHPEWWALPPAERADRRHKLASLPPACAHQPALHPFEFYEAQQPPLYYWLLSVPLRLTGAWHLAARVLLIRLLSMLLASLTIPLTWITARKIVGPRLALVCAALLAVAPGFAIDVSRVANDSLAIALVAVLLWLLTGSRPGWFLPGLILGACLLTKAYLLAFLPALAVILWRRRQEMVRIVVLALLVAGWWYLRNLAVGHTFSGWLLRPDRAAMLRAIVHINWLSAAHVAAKSFLWFGAWSFLTLKAWIYALLEGAGFIGLLLAAKSRNTALKAPATLLAFFVAGMAYGILATFVTENVPNLPGWYLWSLGGAIAVLVVAGLRRFSLALVAALAAVDLYGVTGLLTPYYAGLVERNHADVAQFPTALTRLGISPWLTGAWLLATLGIVAIAAMTDYEGRKLNGHQRGRDPQPLRAAVR